MKLKQYTIIYDENFVKPYAVFVKSIFGNFWQQVSPWYFHKKNAENWAKRYNIKLEN